MKYGLHMPLVDPHTLAEMAVEGEAAGWDGIYVWDMIWGIDVWVALAAVALQTERMRIGTIITPLSRRRPWKVASEAVTLDHLSHGRFTLPVGLGAPDAGFDNVGEATDRKTRAQMLDESLAILDGLWSGQPFSYHGAHYQLNDVTFEPRPVQQPRIPIWVVAAWPRPRSLERALRWDGIMPVKMPVDQPMTMMQPDDLREMQTYIQQRRSATTPFDVVIEGETPGDDPARAAAAGLGCDARSRRADALVWRRHATICAPFRQA
jgi:hypothetical protein